MSDVLESKALRKIDDPGVILLENNVLSSKMNSSDSLSIFKLQIIVVIFFSFRKYCRGWGSTMSTQKKETVHSDVHLHVAVLHFR